MSQQLIRSPSEDHQREHDVQFNLDNQDELAETITVGSRKSELALIQTKKVIKELTEAYRNKASNKLDPLNYITSRKDITYNFDIIAMTTTGDNILDRSLTLIGSKSLFTRELEIALLNNEVDFIVHSLKDLPTTLPEGCIIGAILPRDDSNDVLVLKKCLIHKLDPMSLLNGTISDNIRVGTSSQRRIALLKRCNPNIECSDIRGNLNTRFRKLDDDNSKYSAIVLAAAGLDRMNMSNRASLNMGLINDSAGNSEIKWPYAVGQGAIAVECRKGDTKILDLLKPIVCLRTTYETAAERAMMRVLEGGCSIPMGVQCKWLGEHILELTGVVLSLDGQQVVECSATRDLSKADIVPLVDELSDLTGISLADKEEQSSLSNSHLKAAVLLGYEVAMKMIDKGAKILLDATRRQKLS